MKIKLFACAALLASATLSATPLSAPATVHAKPDRSAPAIGILAAGTEPEYAAASTEPVPSGWEAVTISSNHDAYVAAKDVAKSLDVKIGAQLRVAPKADATLLGTMEAGDYAEIVGVKGKWTQIRLVKKRVGYIHTGSTTTGVAQAAPAPAAIHSSPAAPAQAPAAPTASTFGGAGRPVETVGIGDSGTASLPRLFQGNFASSRRPLMPRRPYDYQLNDANGDRYAYLDISRLLLTEQIDKYIDHSVVVYGTAKPVENTRDIVIVVESLQLR